MGMFLAGVTYAGARLDIDGIAVEAVPINKSLVGHGEAILRMPDGRCDVTWQIL